MNASSLWRLCALALLLLPAPAAAQVRLLVDSKEPGVTATQEAQTALGRFFQNLEAECDEGAVSIQSSGNQISELRFDQKHFDLLDQARGTPSVSIQIAATGYSGTLVGTPDRCRLETKTRSNGSKARARLDCKLGKNGQNLSPPPDSDDAAAAAAACKGSKRISIDKDLSRVEVSLKGTFQ